MVLSLFGLEEKVSYKYARDSLVSEWKYEEPFLGRIILLKFYGRCTGFRILFSNKIYKPGWKNDLYA